MAKLHAVIRRYYDYHEFEELIAVVSGNRAAAYQIAKNTWPTYPRKFYKDGSKIHEKLQEDETPHVVVQELELNVPYSTVIRKDREGCYGPRT